MSSAIVGGGDFAPVLDWWFTRRILREADSSPRRQSHSPSISVINSRRRTAQSHVVGGLCRRAIAARIMWRIHRPREPRGWVRIALGFSIAGGKYHYYPALQPGHCREWNGIASRRPRTFVVAEAASSRSASRCRTPFTTLQRLVRATGTNTHGPWAGGLGRDVLVGWLMGVFEGSGRLD